MKPLPYLVTIACLLTQTTIHAEDKARPLDFMWVMRSWDLPKGQEVTALAMSSDGERIAISGSHYLAIQDRKTGNDIWRIENFPHGTSWALHFSPDGKKLIVSCSYLQPGDFGSCGTSFGNPNDPKTKNKNEVGIVIIDAQTGKALREITSDPGGNSDALLSPDGKLILSLGGSVHFSQIHTGLWNAQTGEKLTETDEPKIFITGAAFLPDGKSYLCSGNRALTMVDTLSGKISWQINAMHSLSISVSPKGEYAAVCEYDEGLSVFKIADKKNQRIGQHLGVTGSAFVDDEHFLTWGRELRMWNAKTCEEVSWSGLYEQNVKMGATGGNYFLGGTANHMSVWGLPGIGTAPPEAAPLIGVALQKDLRPFPPLIIASGNDEHRVRALLAHGADVNGMQGLADRCGNTALHSVGNYEIARALVEAGADVNAISADNWNRSPIHCAVERWCLTREADGLLSDVDSMKIIDLLLDMGANIEATYGYNVTPLQIAAKAGNRGVCAHLVLKGAYYDIFSAAALGDLARIEVLLEENPQLVHERNTVTKQNALYWASTKRVIRRLVIAGSEADITDAWNSKPSDSLRGNRHEDLADELDKLRPNGKSPQK